MTKEIHDINTRALDFVVELIEYIFEYPDDDYMTMECLCRKLHKYGLVDKKDGFYLAADDTLRKTENSSEKPNNCETCRNKGFEGCEQPCLGCGWCDLYEPKDEPTTQTETQNSNLTFEKADERCKGCKHYKLTCDLFSEICKYEPKDEPTISKMEQVEDEPQTDCAWK